MPGSPPAPLVNPDDYPLLSARHVDDLTSSTRGLTRAVQELQSTCNKLLLAIRDLTRAIGGNVTRQTQENLPAVVHEDPNKPG